MAEGKDLRDLTRAVNGLSREVKKLNHSQEILNGNIRVLAQMMEENKESGSADEDQP